MNRGKIARLSAQILIMASIIIITTFSGLSPLTFAQSNQQENISPVIIAICYSDWLEKSTISKELTADVDGYAGLDAFTSMTKGPVSPSSPIIQE